MTNTTLWSLTSDVNSLTEPDVASREPLIRLARQPECADLTGGPRWLVGDLPDDAATRGASRDRSTQRHHVAPTEQTRGAGTSEGSVRPSRIIGILAIVLAATVLVTACNGGSSRGELAELHLILASCDPAEPPGALVLLDGTGSSASEAIIAERMAVVESVTRRTAVCSGHLRVLVFSASSAATITLFDGRLQMHGATQNARLKRVPDAVAEVMEKVRQGYGPAVASLPGGGSDITAQYRLAAEWIGQLGDPYWLHLYVLTDGFQTIGVDLGAQAMSSQEAAALADQVLVPKLPGASVVVAGLGRVAEGAPPSSVVEGLKVYYDELCRKTAASECLSVTDYATEGR